MAQSCPSALLGVPGKKLHCAFFILSCNKVLLKEIYYFYVNARTDGRSVVRSFSVGLIFPKIQLFYFTLRKGVVSTAFDVKILSFLVFSNIK